MSESDIAIRPLTGTRGMPVPVTPDTEETSRPAVVADGTTRFGALLRLLFSFPAMLGTCLVGRVFYEGRQFSVDPDSWWHIRVGQGILDTHHWLTTDPFSFTATGAPWIAYEWGGEVLMGAVERFAGWRGLDALLVILGSAVMVALYYYATLRCGNSKAGFLAAGLLCSLAAVSFNLRPQMLGYLFLILTLIALERFRQGKPRALWFLPALFLVWINTHGSWVVGLGIIFVFWASGLVEFRFGSIEAQRWRPAQRIRLELIFLLCLAAIPLTPYGTRLASFPFMMAFSLPGNVENIMEWLPMPFNVMGGKLFLAIVLAFFAAQMVFRPAWRLAEMVLFLGGIAMACLHVRFLLLFVPFSAPLLAVLFARWLPRYDRAKEHYVLNAVIIMLVLGAMVWYFPSRADLLRSIGKTYPVGAVEYMRQHPVPGPMYNNYGYGGYLIYSRWPEHKVFIDGRGELYEVAGVFGDYMEVTDLKPAAFAVLRTYGIQSFLLERKEPLATVLAALPEWQQVYSDNASVIFVHRNP